MKYVAKISEKANTDYLMNVAFLVETGGVTVTAAVVVHTLELLHVCPYAQSLAVKQATHTLGLAVVMH
jgi:hypothetical protein